MICAQISRPALYEPTRTFVSTAVLHKNYWTSASVRMLDDGEHVIKKGPWDLILSEYHAYTLLQHEAQFPVVCEHFVSGGPGSETAEMLLHRVIGLDTLFDDHAPFLFPVVARCAQHLIEAMSRMHRHSVLHCDIHPGNIAFTSCLSMEVLLGKKLCPPAGMLIPTFIDLEWARVEGYHCRLEETPTCWPFSSDRALCGFEPYCEADDLVSLAYVILALAFMAVPPWFKKLQDSDAVMYLDAPSSQKTIINTRKKCLRQLRRSGEVAGLILDFISYAEQLPHGERPDYNNWADQFDHAAAAAPVGAGDSELYAHML